jgi:phenylacetaldehyde dehydrogenase
MTSSIAVFDTASTLSEATKRFLGKKHRLFIGGEWVTASSGATRDVVDPATGATISTMANGDAKDVDLAVKAAREAFEGGPWRTMPTSERAKIIWKIGTLIDEHAEELAQLEVLDEGSPYNVVKNFYVRLGAEHFRYYSGWATKITGTTIPVNMPGEWHAYTVREPIGVVGQIIPWNVPLLMLPVVPSCSSPLRTRR